MNLVRLLGRLGPAPLRQVAAGAAASALGCVAALAVVNLAASDIAARQGERVSAWMAAAFIASVLVYAVSESWMVGRMGVGIEEAIDGLRMKLIEMLRHADLWKLERFGESRLYESITQSCQTVSANSQFLALSLRSALIIVAVMAYILAISPLAFAVIGVTVAAGAVVYRRLGSSLEQRQTTLAAEESALFECVTDLFDGFQEQRLNSARSRDLNAWFVRVSTATMEARNEVHLRGWQQYVFGETGYTLMLGIVVFAVPSYSTAFDAQVVKVTAACLFMASSVFGLMQSVAVMAAAEAASGRMLSLERELALLAETGSAAPGLPVGPDFREIRLRGVEFAFPSVDGERGFGVGPFDLTIRRGETIFITGGNGSGKSTFLKLLTRLYHPLRGTVEVDGIPIGPERLSGYRSLMATVFTDFHLFSRLYGADVASSEGEELVRWMELERSTALSGGRFTRRDLSAGQRKRLALIAALLERKPILVLDEWAADQDPQFRARFYREVLPELRRRGLTVLAVTHDDHYFDTAGRRLHMEDGRLTELAAGGAA
jgi:putative ATP-binding cassette transporter